MLAFILNNFMLKINKTFKEMNKFNDIYKTERASVTGSKNNRGNFSHCFLKKQLLDKWIKHFPKFKNILKVAFKNEMIEMAQFIKEFYREIYKKELFKSSSKCFKSFSYKTVKKNFNINLFNIIYIL